MRYFVTLALVLVPALIGGCSDLQSGTGTGLGLNLGQAKSQQSQEKPYTDDGTIKMKIDRCYWATSIPTDSYGQMYQPLSNVPQATRSADDAFLIVELAMTNYGNGPQKPRSPPLFELVSADGKTYQTMSQIANMTQTIMMGGNINPGRAIKTREVFDVPKGQYDLKVIVSRYERFGIAEYGPVAWVWQLTPTETE